MGAHGFLALDSELRDIRWLYEVNPEGEENLEFSFAFPKLRLRNAMEGIG